MRFKLNWLICVFLRTAVDNVESGKVDANSVVQIWLDRLYAATEEEEPNYFGPDEWSSEDSYFDSTDEWDWGEFDDSGEPCPVYSFANNSSEDRGGQRFDK